jgi:hypothetical protein
MSENVHVESCRLRAQQVVVQRRDFDPALGELFCSGRRCRNRSRRETLLEEEEEDADDVGDLFDGEIGDEEER